MASLRRKRSFDASKGYATTRMASKEDNEYREDFNACLEVQEAKASRVVCVMLFIIGTLGFLTCNSEVPR
jgi:hypothetical protein